MSRRLFRAAAFMAASFVLLPHIALAQAAGGDPSVGRNAVPGPNYSTQIGIRDSSGNLQPASSSNPVPVSGSFSANLAGFTPTTPGAYATISATSTSSNVALPTGTAVLVQNKGTTPAYVNFGTSNSVTAAVTNVVVPAGGGCALAVPAGNTFLAGIEDSGNSGTLTLTGGSGLGSACYGGGSSGSGSNGFVAQGSTTSGQTGPLIQGAVTTSAPSYTTAQTSPLSLDTAGNVRDVEKNSASILSAIQAAIPTGTNSIGNVYLWAQPGSWVQGTLTSAMTGTTSTSLLAAPGGSLHNYLVTIMCDNASASVSTGVTIQDGNGGTQIAHVAAAAVQGGTALTFGIPLKQPTAATALYVVDDTTGAAVKCTATGFTQ